MFHLCWMTAIAVIQDPGSISIQGGARFTREPLVRVTVSPPLLSPPVSQMSIGIDEGPWGEWQPAESAQVTLPKGEGPHTLRAKFRNAAGTETAPVSASIILDTLPPVPKLSCAAFQEGVILTSNVPDAVAMKIVKPSDPTSAWEAFATPKFLKLSSSSDPFQVLYRDEAGNESVPETAVIPPPGSAGTPEVLLADIAVSVRAAEDQKMADLRIQALGMQEMEVFLNDQTILARGKFNSEVGIALPASADFRRVRIRLWSGAQEYEGRCIFQDGDPSPPAEEIRPPLPPVDASLSTGLWFIPAAFESVISSGPRELEAGGLWLVRAELGLNLFDPLLFSLSGEYAGGEAVEISVIGLDARVRCASGGIGQVFIEFGGFASTFRILDEDFGDFDPAMGARVGARLKCDFSDSVILDLGLDYRLVRFEYSEDVFLGDEELNADGIVVRAGMSLGF